MRLPLIWLSALLCVGCVESRDDADSASVAAATSTATPPNTGGPTSTPTAGSTTPDSGSYGMPAGYYLPATRTQLGGVVVEHFELLGVFPADLTAGPDARSSVTLRPSTGEWTSFECHTTEVSIDTLRILCDVGELGRLELAATPTDIVRPGWTEHVDSVFDFEGPVATGTISRIGPDGSRFTEAVALRYFTGD